MSAGRSTAQAESACLEEDEVLAFAGGDLPAEERERAHQHLDSCAECQQLLSEAVRALATARTAGQGGEELHWSTSFRPGMLVGERYVIRRFIARGGMGEVYEAFDQELNDRVALKTVTSTASDDPGAVRRLKAEVQLARRVSHPNVCRIYDFGTHRGAPFPLSFLTMEFVEGETLGRHLRQHGPFRVAEAVALARALLRGLAAAHAAGVLHRDFKCENVVLRREAERLEPLILDFGLARALDYAAVESQNSARGLVGTLAYMPPEQLEGQPYTTASDVYSFGLVLFEMLTGELPFQTRSSPALTTLDRLTRPIAPPSRRNADIPSELDAVVLACLRRNPRERLQTAAEVLARLESLDERREPKRKPWAVMVAVASVALTAAFVLVLASAGSRGAASGSEVAAHLGAPPLAGSSLAVKSPPASILPAPEVAASAVEPKPQVSPSASPSASAPPPEALRGSPKRAPRRADARPAPAASVAAPPEWENPFAVRPSLASADSGSSP